MESSIAVFLKRWTASELPPTFGCCPLQPLNFASKLNSKASTLLRASMGKTQPPCNSDVCMSALMLFHRLVAL